MPTNSTTLSASTPCPSWCEDTPGHEYPTEPYVDGRVDRFHPLTIPTTTSHAGHEVGVDISLMEAADADGSRTDEPEPPGSARRRAAPSQGTIMGMLTSPDEQEMTQPPERFRNLPDAIPLEQTRAVHEIPLGPEGAAGHDLVGTAMPADADGD